MRVLVAEYKTIVRIFDSFVNKPCLGKFNSCRATRIVQCNCFCIEYTDIFGVDSGRVNLFLQSYKFVKGKTCNVFFGHAAVFLCVGDKLRFALRYAVFFRNGCRFVVVRRSSVNHGMNGLGFFKSLSHDFGDRFFQFFVAA